MNKAIGLGLSIIIFYLFGRSPNLSMDAFYIGTCLLIAGFMTGDIINRKGNKK